MCLRGATISTPPMEDTLVLVHVIFRHGDRTPDKNCIYPKDPHKDVNYHPIGHSQLTNTGKKRAYKLGQVLRKRYHMLLGDFYTPGIVDPCSSDTDRTKMTLQLVLASLFPPREEHLWDKALPWQPIPYRYFTEAEDNYFMAIVGNSMAVETYGQHVRGPGKKILDNNAGIIQYIEKNTGLNIDNMRKILMLAVTLNSEQSLGLELPAWTDSVWPNLIEELATLEYDALASTTRLKAFASGKILEKIVGDTKSKIDGKSDCKIHLYSGHELTVGVFLRCLGISFRHVPHFCANVRLELHKISGVYGFKVYYQAHPDELPQLLSLPNSDSFYPVEDFFALLEDVLEETKLVLPS